MTRACIYFRTPPERDRWLPGDRLIRPIIRRAIRGKPRRGGVEKVFINLCLGLDRLGVPYEVNLPFDQLSDDDRVGVLGRGRHALKGYVQSNPIVAGIGLMTHPSEWPTLFDEYPVAIYLQHSEWAKAVYEPYFGDRCQIWPVGIDTDAWYPNLLATKRFDFLIYDKIRWQREKMISRLLAPIRSELQRRNLSYREIEYGFYSEEQYKEALHSCRYMIFLCEHESQGIAYLEGLASNVPMLAWDQGWCLDPARWAWGQAEIPTTSVPYFDARCGLRFINIQEFSQRLTQFLDLERDGTFAPREYVNENLTLEKCSAWFLRILNDAQVHDRAPDG